MEIELAQRKLASFLFLKHGKNFSKEQLNGLSFNEYLGLIEKLDF